MAIAIQVPSCGATISSDGSGTTFRLWAPNASAINVQVIPPSSSHEPTRTIALQQEQENSAYWSTEAAGVTAGWQYLFELTNKGGDTFDPGGPPFWRTDPCARQVSSGEQNRPAVVVDPNEFAFTSPFQTPAFENFIIYQAHVGSFSGRNDGLPVQCDSQGGTATFADCETKLDYIRDMNFNAIQFLPNGEYSGTEGEAYNPSDYYAPERLYGTPDELRHLVDACHRHGLAVFFDVVYNHMDNFHNLWQFDGNTDHRTNPDDPATGGGIYFSTVDTGFGRRPDHDSPDVQIFFRENARMWFNEYKIDGLRFDSVMNFSEAGLKAIVQPLIAAFPDKFIYAEDNDTTYTFGTIGFRASWDMDSADTFAQIVGKRDISGLRDLLGRFGYPTAYSAIKYLLGSHDQIFNAWIYNEAQASGYWAKPAGNGLRENRYFVERIGGDITGRENWYARAQSRLGWALNVTMPCTPMLFMGSECYHYGYWNPASDLWGDHRFDWSIAGDPIGWEMRGLVRDVNEIRWNHPALRSDNGPLVSHFDTQNGVLAFRRWNDDGDVLLVVVNLSDNQWNDPSYAVNAGEGGEQWTEIFNSQAPQYGGWESSGNYPSILAADAEGQFSIRLPQWSVLIFQKTA